MNLDQLLRIMPYAIRRGEQTFETESYVSTPPAAVVMDSAGSVWTLGLEFHPDGWRGHEGVQRGEFCFNVLRDGIDVGEWAMRIERRSGRIKIYGPDGWKAWNGRTFI